MQLSQFFPAAAPASKPLKSTPEDWRMLPSRFWEQRLHQESSEKSFKSVLSPCLCGNIFCQHKGLFRILSIATLRNVLLLFSKMRLHIHSCIHCPATYETTGVNTNAFIYLPIYIPIKAHVLLIYKHYSDSKPRVSKSMVKL